MSSPSIIWKETCQSSNSWNICFYVPTFWNVLWIENSPKPDLFHLHASCVTRNGIEKGRTRDCLLVIKSGVSKPSALGFVPCIVPILMTFKKCKNVYWVPVLFFKKVLVLMSLCRYCISYCIIKLCIVWVTCSICCWHTGAEEQPGWTRPRVHKVRPCATIPTWAS